jgi:hypothetical protein
VLSEAISAFAAAVVNVWLMIREASVLSTSAVRMVSRLMASSAEVEAAKAFVNDSKFARMVLASCGDAAAITSSRLRRASR